MEIGYQSFNPEQIQTLQPTNTGWRESSTAFFVNGVNPAVHYIQRLLSFPCIKRLTWQYCIAFLKASLQHSVRRTVCWLSCSESNLLSSAWPGFMRSCWTVVSSIHWISAPWQFQNLLRTSSMLSKSDWLSRDGKDKTKRDGNGAGGEEGMEERESRYVLNLKVLYQNTSANCSCLLSVVMVKSCNVYTPNNWGHIISVDKALINN